ETLRMGWPTGLEPATARTTIWGSTIELRPPIANTLDFRMLTVKFSREKSSCDQSPNFRGAQPPSAAVRCASRRTREARPSHQAIVHFERLCEPRGRDTLRLRRARSLKTGYHRSGRHLSFGINHFRLGRHGRF